MPTNILDKELLAWISRNRYTFLLVVLIAGNVYQYINRLTLESQCETDRKALNEQIQKMGRESLDYERQRGDKLEFLFQNLSKIEENASKTFHDNKPRGRNDK